MKVIKTAYERFGAIPLCLGMAGENGVTMIRVDLRTPLEEYPNAWFGIAVESPDGTCYPAVAETEGDTLIWIVSRADTAKSGRGNAQVVMYGENGEIERSKQAPTTIMRSIQTNENAPDPVEEWIDKALKLLEELKNYEVPADQIEQVIKDYLEKNPPPGVSMEDVNKTVEEAIAGAKIPTKTSDLSNDSGFITKAVSDLTNYYLKAETYSRDEIDQRIRVIPKFSISVVAALPASGISETTIYLLKSGSDTDLYTEYIYVNGAWEPLGSQRVDLTGYATETWVIGKLNDYQPKGEYLTQGNLDAAVEDALEKANESGEFDGVGIAAIITSRTPNEKGEIEIAIKLTDGQIHKFAVKYGADGNGIASAVMNDDYTLTLNFTDGTSYTTPSIKGSDANVTTENIKNALGYTPADAETVSQVSADMANKVTSPSVATVGQVISVKAVDENGKPTEWEAVDMSGGASSWNDLTDKPVVMAGGDTLNWDGNTDGLVSVEGAIFKVSDAALTKENFVNGASWVIDGEKVELDSSTLQGLFQEDGFMTINVFFIVPFDGYDWNGTIFPKKGLYFMSMDGSHIETLTIPGYTGFAQEKIAPSHLYQPDWNQNDASAADFIKNRPFGETYGDTLTWDGTFDENSVLVEAFGCIKVSDAVLSMADLANGCVAYIGEEPLEVSADMIQELYNGIIMLCDGLVWFISENGVGVDVDGAVFAEAGTYMMYVEQPVKLVVPNTLCFATTQMIDAKYLPRIYTEQTVVYVGMRDGVPRIFKDEGLTEMYTIANLASLVSSLKRVVVRDGNEVYDAVSVVPGSECIVYCTIDAGQPKNVLAYTAEYVPETT